MFTLKYECFWRFTPNMSEISSVIHTLKINSHDFFLPTYKLPHLASIKVVEKNPIIITY